MTLPKRSLTAQIDEVRRTIGERRSNRRSSADEYRLDSLKAALATLEWLEEHAEIVKAAARGMKFTHSISPSSITSSKETPGQGGGGDGNR